jgi:hypothetical protein
MGTSHPVASARDPIKKEETTDEPLPELIEGVEDLSVHI